MGWAKYCEDNIEIMLERQILMQSRMQETEIRVVYKNNNKAISKLVLTVNESTVIEEKSTYSNKYIVCKDCGTKFLFTASSQKHFEEKGWCEPKRCKCCRDYRNTRYLMCSSF